MANGWEKIEIHAGNVQVLHACTQQTNSTIDSRFHLDVFFIYVASFLSSVSDKLFAKIILDDLIFLIEITLVIQSLQR